MPKLEGAWKPFTEAGLLPDPSGLFLIARAITPPGRVRRFDTRFFTADASAIAHRVEGVIHADAELVELVWVEIGSKPLADLHAMTKNVLAELERRLATGPLRHDAPVPFFHFYGGRMQKDVLARLSAADRGAASRRSIPYHKAQTAADPPSTNNSTPATKLEIVRGEKQRGLGDFIDVADAPQRHERRHVALHLVVGEHIKSRRLDRTGAENVDPDMRAFRSAVHVRANERMAALVAP